MPRILVQTADFDTGAEIARLGDGQGDTGGIASFIGQVRGGDVAALTLEHYPGMTERALQALADQAGQRWALTGCTIIHRVGRLCPGDNIVLVATAAPHRAAALQATAFLIDRLKTGAPFWKQEELASGERRWVAARPEDSDAAARWTSPVTEAPPGGGGACSPPGNPASPQAGSVRG